MIIAIDGPAASGKGTIAKQVAAIYGLPHLDTGLIYRAVAKALHLREAMPSDFEAQMARTAEGVLHRRAAHSGRSSQDRVAGSGRHYLARGGRILSAVRGQFMGGAVSEDSAGCD